jgi:hypothetical protein
MAYERHDAAPVLQNDGRLTVQCRCGYADGGYMDTGPATASAVTHNSVMAVIDQADEPIGTGRWPG